MDQEIKIPKVFISYAWTSEEHNDWVVALATRLVESGVDVKFDKWDLKEGNDIYAFMESMVTSEDIDKVLIICDKGYREKADNRAGGVGTETQIITPEVYADVNQQKFIPIVAERNENGENFIPVYIKSRLYIDLSSDNVFEEGFEKLLRSIFNKPLLQKPILGKPPAYLFDETVTQFKTTNALKQLNDAIIRNPKRVKSLTNQFVENLVESLEQFRIEGLSSVEGLDDLIYEYIDKMIPLRNDYVQFLEALSDNETIETDTIVSLFENLYKYTYFSGSGRYYEAQYSHFKFFIQELFIYTTMILLEKKQYSKLSELLTSEFYITDKYQESRRIGFVNFRFYLGIFDEVRNRNLGLNKLSLTAHYLVQRSNLRRYPMEKLVAADLMLYYLSIILSKHFDYTWFPCTYVYGEHKQIDLLSRLRSRRYFENIKVLFEVDTAEQIKEKIISFNNENGRGYQQGYSIPSLRAHINPDEICTIP
ncbi:SEFIR domain-containing protein [Brevibacillus centrosporus]|uniref:SEFIR domain-containing protein n=1 Tax=Brevibacillus centrosporus TaxID=54910 RepID=UPI002E217411|nr:TIR domain-containing protein [Brevibacillus centrosporus]